jgi:hypothetical protein
MELSILAKEAELKVETYVTAAIYRTHITLFKSFCALGTEHSPSRARSEAVNFEGDEVCMLACTPNHKVAP